MKKIENKLKELLKVIDIEVCELSCDSITINDSLYPDRYNEVIELPVEYKTEDDLRVFKSAKINESYFFRVLNTKYHKTPFNKNGVEFEITMSKTTDDKKDEEDFNLELFHNGIYYMIFIGKNHDEKYICCRIKDKEWMDFSYIINPKNEKGKREISVSFNSLCSRPKKLTATDDKGYSFIEVENFSDFYSDFSEAEIFPISDNDINKYFNAIAFKLKNVIANTIEVINITNENFLNIIFSDFPFVEEFVNLSNNENEEKLVNEFFNRCSSINISDKEKKLSLAKTKEN